MVPWWQFCLQESVKTNTIAYQIKMFIVQKSVYEIVLQQHFCFQEFVKTNTLAYEIKV
jgi:hypothetical protein